ncbi:HAMP domain-containing histidine kinase [Phormidium sp. CLA17]|uniref:sensor histidine kinase n=1 Tax=Leptolyngbya sp. Cla-17 TaxID=2803751 RepID=UPI001492684A|nr:HAMP domain-containing sensor histidine kinase [Leptolyngbya sp. Cla-17]MBM0741563.1 HAMP domain-containing histidine kinase [Leptolyngbya sp. Cla-17]
MSKWLLPTLSEVIALNDPTWMGTSDSASNVKPEPPQRFNSRAALQQLKVEREWYGAISALSVLLQHHLTIPNTPAYAAAQTVARTLNGNGDQAISGVILSGPTPIFNHPQVVKQFATRTLAATSLDSPHWMPFQLLPAESETLASDHPLPILPLLPGDPLAAEPFCLVLTPWFSLVMVLGETLTQEPAFLFSFVPEVVQQAWEAIRPRILLMTSHQVDHLDELIHQFAPVSPDYKTVMQFSRLMLELPPSEDEQPEPIFQATGFNVSNETLKKEITQNVAWSNTSSNKTIPVQAELDEKYLDVELVQAIAHEVRTPLTTIRTLTRSLLKRLDLAPDVLKRLSIIDRECSEQIDRFGLIFRAMELETTTTHQPQMSLIRTSVVDVFQQSIPRWQQQASQRQMTLDIVVPETMPAVVSDPTMLEQVLTSLIERFTRNLPAGSHIQVDVTLAGDQLKLQLQSLLDTASQVKCKGLFGTSLPKPSPKSIGHMLMFQPDTGSLSLTLAVTKSLFQAIGGKLTVKQRPKAGEIMTVYLPLEMERSPLESSTIITI